MMDKLRIELTDLDRNLLSAAYRGANKVATDALDAGARVDAIDPKTGMAALHLATGTNNGALARTRVESYGASFFPDAFGRMPSVVAIDCTVDDDVADYVVGAEARALKL